MKGVKEMSEWKHEKNKAQQEKEQKNEEGMNEPYRAFFLFN